MKNKSIGVKKSSAVGSDYIAEQKISIEVPSIINLINVMHIGSQNITLINILREVPEDEVNGVSITSNKRIPLYTLDTSDAGYWVITLRPDTDENMTLMPGDNLVIQAYTTSEDEPVLFEVIF